MLERLRLSRAIIHCEGAAADAPHAPLRRRRLTRAVCVGMITLDDAQPRILELLEDGGKRLLARSKGAVFSELRSGLVIVPA